MNALEKTYNAETVDAKWYAFWEKNGYFTADSSSSKTPYCIVMPPPNVTGVLHMGHALVNTLQDILVRWKRMKGYEVLWVPGTDHAGIATQTVVERHLMKISGKRRKDFSREDFLSHVWAWKDKSQSEIITQLKKLGSSCDWTRLRFTMDEENNLAVKSMFKKLYDSGLIYRGDYLVNWDPVTQTALADDEVEYEEKHSFLWHFKYPLADGSGFVRIATTRPETMLGDSAIAISPKDQRYARLLGKKVLLPLMNREIPIIEDHLVDPEFGTGMVKVTPAHDPNDYQMGLVHGLDFINIMTPDGKINENGGAFKGMSMQEAREAVVGAMKALGFLEKIEPHLNRVGVSYRSKAVIEPYLSKQWFVKMEGFKEKLLLAVKNGEFSLVPKTWENTYFHWINNLRDWCISRQLWWGHRIPIWYHKDDPSKMICYDGEGLPKEVKENPELWKQDEDVLDTWFSSALWPFSTLGWPKNTPDFQKFYPNACLITGHDILFFWVARMILMGEEATGEVPFKEAFLHGLIYGKSYWRSSPDGGIVYVSEEERREFDLGKPVPKDVFSRWEKMSKSKGNIIDPLEIIRDYGTDAMRMGLTASASQSREIDLDRRRFEDFKNFANKVWNGARFVFLNLDGDPSQNLTPLTPESFSQGLDLERLCIEDRWLLSVLNKTIQSVEKKLENYQFDQSALEAYDFFWKEFCSYYVEIAKPVLFGKAGDARDRLNKQKLLAITLCKAVRLMHPMAPFITEELFHHLKTRLSKAAPESPVDPYTKECLSALQSASCMTAPYPEVINPQDISLEIENAFDLLQRIVYAIRNIRGEMKFAPGVATDVHVVCEKSTPEFSFLEANKRVIAALVKTSGIYIHSSEPALKFSSKAFVDKLQIILPMPEQMLSEEKLRLSKEKLRLEASKEKIAAQLENEDFVRRAPAALIEKQKVLLEQTESDYLSILAKLSKF